MEFWGVEVKAGQPLKVKPGTDKLIHLSQASLGESKKSKEDERIFLSVKFDKQKLVLGTLSSAKFPQLSFDLVFEKEFELSHNWKNGSVYFTGYRSVTAEDNEFSDTESEEEENLHLRNVENIETKPSKQAKANANATKSEASKKPKEKIVEKMDVDEEDSDEDDEDDDEDDSDEDDESDDKGSDSEADSDDDDDKEEEEEDKEETPKKAELGKKRAPESAKKTPDAKRVKAATPLKRDGKNNATTPKVGKQSGRTPAADKSKTQTPKSAGQVSCKSCSKTFNSDAALQSHSKAKHGGK